jgi:ABC-type transport system substrate-binding protein
MWKVYRQYNRLWRYRFILAIIGGLLLIAYAVWRSVNPNPQLVLQISGPPVSLDPARASSYEERLIDGALYERLVAYDPETRLARGILAEKWDVSQGGQVYTFYLRQNLCFDDGSPVTAQDVKASWERVLDPGVGNCSYLLTNVAGSDEKESGASKDVSGLVAVDRYTFRVVLKEPDYTFPMVASSPILAVISQKAATKQGEAYGKTPAAVVGTGPYRLVSWGKDRLVLQRNRRYAGDWPQVKTLTFLVVSRPDQVISLCQAGKLDVLAEPPPQALSALVAKAGSSGFTVLKKPVLNLYFLGLNLKQAPLDSKDLRRAIGQAIDKAAVADQSLGNEAKALSGFLPADLIARGTAQGQAAGASGQSAATVTAAESAGGQPVQAPQAAQGTGGQPGQAPQAAESAGGQPDAATQALAAAGFPYGMGLPTLTLAFNDSPGHDYLAHLIQGDLEKVGVNLQLKSVPWQNYEAAVRTGAYALFRLGWDADYAEPGNLLYFNFDSAEKSRGNLTGYSSSEFDSLMRQARAEQSDDRRLEIYRQAEQVLEQDAPIIPLFQQVLQLGLRKEVSNCKVDLLGMIDFDHLRKT